MVQAAVARNMYRVQPKHGGELGQHGTDRSVTIDGHIGAAQVRHGDLWARKGHQRMKRPDTHMGLQHIEGLYSGCVHDHWTHGDRVDHLRDGTVRNRKEHEVCPGWEMRLPSDKAYRSAPCVEKLEERSSESAWPDDRELHVRA